MREIYRITNTDPKRIFSLSWQPRTFTIYNYSAFPVYMNIGSVAFPSPLAFTDIIPAFAFYSTDPVGSFEFAIWVYNVGSETVVFALPVNVIFSSGSASFQAALSTQL